MSFAKDRIKFFRKSFSEVFFNLEKGMCFIAFLRLGLMLIHIYNYSQRYKMFEKDICRSEFKQQKCKETSFQKLKQLKLN